jgi:hypothetical protein
MRRWLDQDGTEVFFDSSQPLVPQDTNRRQDVYEWEREGAGSCPHGAPGGSCVYLLSGGTNLDNAFFVDADASGENVFFTSRAQLVPQDKNDRFDLFDARVGGGFPEVSLACTGSGCQGVPPAPPIFATPSSVTFSGVGNFPYAPPPRSGKPKPKSAKCKKGFIKKHGKCVKAKVKHKNHKAKRASANRRGQS